MTGYEPITGVAVMDLVGPRWMSLVDVEWAEFAKCAREQDRVVVKGLLRQYASAVERGDRERAAVLSKAFADEVWTVDGQQMRRRVGRDPQTGRFTRTIVSGPMNLPTQRTKKKLRRKGDTVADEAWYEQAVAGERDQALGDRKRLQQALDPNGPARAAMSDDQLAQQEQALAGVEQKIQRMEGRDAQIRGINRFQDELLEVFGDDVRDLRLVVTPRDQSGQGWDTAAQARIPAGQPVADVPLADVPLGQEALQLGFELGPGASSEARRKMEQFNTLRMVGAPPQVAAGAVSGGPGAQQQGPLVDAYGQYRGAQGFPERMERGFGALRSLGGSLLGTGVPQLQAAGYVAERAGAAGEKVPRQVWEAGERANYRYRGRKGSKPQLWSAFEGSRMYQDLLLAQQDQGLNAESWGELRETWERIARAQAEQAEARGSDLPPQRAWFMLVDNLGRNLPYSVSPRAYTDRLQQENAVLSFISSVPMDARSVKVDSGAPSRGMVLPAIGAPTDAYVGVGDDNFTPFSARGLKGLRDAQYVRTRSTGGLTSEDIRTLVASGGRSATVVSGSGVFTINMRPSSGRSRLSSPEVAAMADRYDAILDEIAAGRLYMKDLGSEDKAAINDQLALRGIREGDAAYKEEYEKLERRKRAEMSRLTAAQLQEMRAAAVEQAGKELPKGSAQAQSRLAEELYDDMVSDAKKELVRAMSLNQEGYDLALRTLREQYPDLITSVSAVSLVDWVRERNLRGVLAGAGVTVDSRNRPGAADTVRRSGRYRPAERQQPAEQAEQAPAAAAAPAVSSQEAAAAGAAGGAAAGAAAGAAVSTGNSMAVQRAQQLRTSVGGLKRQIESLQKQLTQGGAELAAFGNQAPPQLSDALATGNPQAAQDFADPAMYERVVQGDVDGVNTVLKRSKDFRPDRMALSAESVNNAAQTAAGTAVAMKAISDNSFFGPMVIDEQTGVERPITEEERRGLRMFVDTLVSAQLLTKAPLFDSTGGIEGNGKVGFRIPSDYGSVLQASIEEKGGKSALDAVEQYSLASPNSAQQQSALTALASMVNKGMLDLDGLIHDGSGWNGDLSAGTVFAPERELSALQMMAAQSAILSAIDQVSADDAGDEQSRLLLSPAPDAFSDRANFDSAKKQAKDAWTELFGTAYLKMMLGGGGAGPKGLVEPPESMVRDDPRMQNKQTVDEAEVQTMVVWKGRRPPRVPMERRLLGV